jgi:hypothetical protein
VNARTGAAALPQVASRLIEDELGYLSAELGMAALDVDWGQQAELDGWIERLARVEATAQSLLATCDALRSSPSLTDDAPGRTATDLGSLMRRALGLCYVDATLLEIFCQRLSEPDLDSLLGTESKVSLETLTRARNRFDRGAYATGWRFVSIFRQGRGLTLVSPPSAD